ncbi:STAS/SEC14 domain-containing protein [Antarcticibacterium flavum]|uniref:STAS/SEC14 domain-containing protein n=2 Tax=Antarcticibacterium TaxID=2058174 RepID=A0A5B7X8N9_9FLAO|nr:MULTISPECIES: STAS/SEC14 domain-containing protein [Antarcticibacterium]MCM4159288.1 STAS/SEC14 domain-containing protein [Antarcticibacterium sp. W02-3]QCY71001.1 STAS/SEC14 domain-containing protein [Antarcticibacterium flavum]QED37180.1 STAS/SEC14 domain-containing protein [Antarcticibacterium arcticum]
MLQILEQTEGNLIATRATGNLTEADYDKLLPRLKNIVEKYQKIRWYFEMEGFEGWKPKAFWKDLKFDIHHANDFEKVAMVGDKKWEEWMTDLMKPFTSAEVKYFATTKKIEAVKWINS